MNSQQDHCMIPAAPIPSRKTTLKNLQGKRFGRLTVVSRFGSNYRRNALWTCVCDCKKTRVVVGNSLLSGNTQSCGCLNIDKMVLRFTRHGQTKGNVRTGVHASWHDMIQRTTNPNNSAWKNYGGRGIRVCTEWLEFENFYAAMGSRPKGLTLDRIDNEKGYEPENCQWTDRRTQNQNQRIRVDNKTGVKGVCICGKYYRAEVTLDGERVCLGRFPLSPEGLQAAVKAIEKAKQLRKIFS